jgi:peptidoglycan hydrolase-like amidase
MCQAGAIARAKRGESRDAILGLYYGGARVETLTG